MQTLTEIKFAQRRRRRSSCVWLMSVTVACQEVLNCAHVVGVEVTGKYVVQLHAYGIKQEDST
jgi:hypothetical protein